MQTVDAAFPVIEKLEHQYRALNFYENLLLQNVSKGEAVQTAVDTLSEMSNGNILITTRTFLEWRKKVRNLETLTRKPGSGFLLFFIAFLSLIKHLTVLGGKR